MSIACRDCCIGDPWQLFGECNRISAGGWLQTAYQTDQQGFGLGTLGRSNFNSYPTMDISNVATHAQSEALSALKRLQDAGWPSSRTILTYQSFDAARLRANEGEGVLLPFLGKLLGNHSVEVRNYGDTFQLKGPYAGVLGWPAQCAYDDRRCWPAADKANLMEVIRGAEESGLPHAERYQSTDPVPRIGPATRGDSQSPAIRLPPPTGS